MKTKRKTVWRKLLVPAAALCLLIAVPPLAAQDDESGGDSGYEQEQQSADDFSDKDLENFATAQTEVEEIRSEYSDELSGVEDTEKAQELQDKYADQMVKAIEDTGLDVQTYNDIAMAIQNDPDLQDKIDELSG